MNKQNTNTSDSSSSSSLLSFSFSSKSKSSLSILQNITPKLPLNFNESDSNESNKNRIIINDTMTTSVSSLLKLADSDSKNDKPALVIPLIKKTQWRVNNKASSSLPHGMQHRAEVLVHSAASKKASQNNSNIASIANSNNKNDLTCVQMNNVSNNNEISSLESQAIQSLLADSENSLNDSNNSNLSTSTASTLQKSTPILLTNSLPGNSSSLTVCERIKLDINQRPSEMEFDEYNRVPIEEFGYGMLRGMGWNSLNDPVGNTNKAVINPVIFQPRGERMGLGAEFAKIKNNKNRL